jgi:DNA-binding NarL/FixJ family response regulator
MRTGVPFVEILIADDHEWFRRTLRSFIESQPEYRVCGEARDGVDAIEKVRRLRPDIVLMDINMPRMDGLEATRIIRRESPDCHVIIVTQNDANIARAQARRVEAKGFVTKSDLHRDLLPTIGRVAMENNSSSLDANKPKHRVSPDGADGIAAGQGEPWYGLLASAAPRDHIVQLYQDQQFLNRAVCRFAAAAIANGEGVILVPTVAHWDAFRPRLESEGVDVKAAE